MADATGERGLSPLQAYEAVMAFARRRGTDALALAMFASVPQVLHIDLLHLLRLNFVGHAPRPGVAETDVLFSAFSHDMGNGYFRFDANARLQLLQHLDPGGAGSGRPPSLQVADFLIAHFARELAGERCDTDPLYRSWIEVERWNAQAFADPEATAEQLAAALRDAVEPGQTRARVRIGALAATLATPLAAHFRLLSYAAGVHALETGDVDRARQLLDSAGDLPVVEGNVTLKPPAQWLRERTPAPVRVKSDSKPHLTGATDTADGVATGRRDDGGGAAYIDRNDVLIVSAQVDRHWSERVQRQLMAATRELECNIVPLDDRQLGGVPQDERGVFWRAEQALGEARVVLVLLSPAYLQTPAFEGLEKTLLQQASSGKVILLWAQIQVCPWSATPYSAFQCVHDPHQALSTAASSGDALLKQIGDATVRAFSRPLASSPQPPAEVSVSIESSSTATATGTVSATGSAGGAQAIGRHLTVMLQATNTDLAAERESLTKALEAQGHRLVRPYTVGEDSPLGAMLSDVASSDVVVVVVGLRYGHVPSDPTLNPHGKSIVELAYDEAVRLDRPVLAMLKREDAQVSPWHVDRRSGEGQRGKLIETFRTRLQRAHVVEYFASADELVSRVSQALARTQQITEPPRAKAPADRVLVFVGHTIDRPGRPVPRFPPEMEDQAAAAIRRAVQAEMDIGDVAYGMSSASDGGDILFLEACAALGLPTRIHLPAPKHLFVAATLVSLAGGWASRFEAVAARSEIVVLPDGDEAFDANTSSATNRMWTRNSDAVLDDAINEGRGDVTIIALWDGLPTESPGGPTYLLARANTLGLRVVTLDTRQIFSGWMTQSSPGRAATKGMAAASIFISYVREDRDAVRHLADMLHKLGFANVLREKLQPSPGNPSIGLIEKSIDDCDYFIAVLSENVERRKESGVFNEWRLALDRAKTMNREFVLPVVVDMATPLVENYPRINSSFRRMFELVPLHAPAGRLDDEAANYLGELAAKSPRRPLSPPSL